MASSLPALRAHGLDMSSIAGSATTPHAFNLLPHPYREELCSYKSPTINLICTYSGKPLNLFHQVQSAECVASIARCKQFQEQYASKHQRCTITLPREAMMIASPYIRVALQENPDTTTLNIHLGGLLPGYVMEACDWYLRALKAKEWVDFSAPDTITMDEHDTTTMDERDTTTMDERDTTTMDERDTTTSHEREAFYYFYLYAAMRILGMNGLAVPLQKFLEDSMAGVRYRDVEGLVRYLGPEDPIFVHLVNEIAGRLVGDQPEGYEAQMENLTAEDSELCVFWRMVHEKVVELV